MRRRCGFFDPVLTLRLTTAPEVRSPLVHFQVFRSMGRAGLEPATLGLKVAWLHFGPSRCLGHVQAVRLGGLHPRARSFRRL